MMIAKCVFLLTVGVVAFGSPVDDQDLTDVSQDTIDDAMEESLDDALEDTLDDTMEDSDRQFFNPDDFLPKNTLDDVMEDTLDDAMEDSDRGLCYQCEKDNWRARICIKRKIICVEMHGSLLTECAKCSKISWGNYWCSRNYSKCVSV